MNAANVSGVDEVPVAVNERVYATVTPVQTMMWSVRRELWENKSIYVAPAVIASLVLLSFVVSLVRHPEVLGFVAKLDVSQQPMALAVPFGATAGLVLFTSFLVGVFYCLDAMYSERKDRSILFWKSLPVSDTTTVASKMIVPMVVLPVVSFVVILVSQILMLAIGTLLMLAHHVNPAILWKGLPLAQMDVVLVYTLVTVVLWHAPVYAWLLLVSSWAKRAILLCAVLPWLALAILEKIAFRSDYVWMMLKARFSGSFAVAFANVLDRSGDSRHVGAMIPMSDMTVGAFLMSPGLWVGLGVAVGLLVLVVRMRRYRTPI